MASLGRKADNLFGLLYTKEFDPEALKKALSSGAYTASEIDAAAFKYVDNCIGNLLEPEGEDLICHFCGVGQIVPGFESSHLTEAISILLEYSLNPNTIMIDGNQEENIMFILHYVNNGFQAADCLRLMLEHGGDPNLVVGGINFANEISRDVIFDVKNPDAPECYEALVHFLMVLTAFGAKDSKGNPPIISMPGFELTKLRDHRKYDFCVEWGKDDFEMKIFDTQSKVVVGKF